MSILLVGLLACAVTGVAQVAVPSRGADGRISDRLLVPSSAPELPPPASLKDELASFAPSIEIDLGAEPPHPPAGAGLSLDTGPGYHRFAVARAPRSSPWTLKQYPPLSLTNEIGRFSFELTGSQIDYYPEAAGLPLHDYALYTSAEAHTKVAYAYLSVHMYTAAEIELAQIPPELRDLPQVLGARLLIHRGRRDWNSMEAIARELLELYPYESAWHVFLSVAVRRGRSLEEARSLLTAAHERYPSNAAIVFNLACYEAQLGRPETAKYYLRRAFEADPNLRATARADVDLLPLHNELNSL